MNSAKRRKSPKRRGQAAKAPSPTGLADVVRETTRLWRKHHLGVFAYPPEKVYSRPDLVMADGAEGAPLRPPASLVNAVSS